MDKNAIKKYAVWARNELIARVTQKAEQYEITEKKTTPADADSIGGRVLTATEKKQRQALIAKINQDGFGQVMEEVAYTWFNRFTALRFMEVNNYLPSHTRVFTNEAGEFKPQILADAIQMDLDGLDMDKVYELKDANKTEELYKYLLITQCNALSSVLPRMFQKIEDFSELLLPDYLLREGSVIERLVAEIPEDNFDVKSDNGQIEIIGWLYQYYNDEKKSYVINMKNSSVKKEDVPAATQLFTTDWVVRYVVDNSVGRYWIERHPDSALKRELEYLIVSQNGSLPVVHESITPQDMTVLDPCMGSGHFLVYTFEVLMKIYIEYGYSEREAAAEIIKNNIFGLDIDERASQLAYFSVMMKARQYDRRFFSKNLQPHVYSIHESNYIDPFAVDYFNGNDEKLQRNVNKLLKLFTDAKEYGSILNVEGIDFDAINNRFCDLDGDISMYTQYINAEIMPLIKAAELISKKYVAVVTNPPYLNKFSGKLKKYVVDNYKAYSGDLFSVFIYKNCEYCIKDGYVGFMTPYVWMFIKTYEKLREYIIHNKSIATLIQMEYSAFEEATVPICSFVIRNGHERGKGLYFKLSAFRGGMDIQRQKVLEAQKNKSCEYYYEVETANFSKIPGSPIAFWAGENTFAAYDANKVADYYTVRNGISTGDNERYLRLWHETDYSLDYWKPCNKGGSYRKWYGNNEYFVYWKDDGHSIRTSLDDKGRIKARLGGIEYSFQEGIEMSRITSGALGFRYSFPGFVYESSTNDVYPMSSRDLYTALAYFNSVVTSHFLGLMNPTINIMPEDLRGLPCLEVTDQQIANIVKENIEISKEDWDSFETSWDFKRHPLVPLSYEKKDQEDSQLSKTRMAKFGLISWHYDIWKKECDDRFETLKHNEESLNRYFINLYKLQEELSSDEDDKEVSVRKADQQREVKSLISYAVGCMFGRYSIDSPGLIYAGGNWDSSKYATFSADKDAIIPICDDEYFDDDIVARFVNFITTVYGKNTLEQNLKYIADSLGGKGTSREVIRNYFLNDFYMDHLKAYQKRPIYWLFDSGRKNGFKCLVYMHRYQPDTIARIRTDYVHEQQSRYRTAIADLENRINGVGTSERVKLNKQLSSLQAQAEEIRVYEEKIHHLADQMIHIDLDDGVKHNYEIFKDVLAKIK